MDNKFLKDVLNKIFLDTQVVEYEDIDKVVTDIPKELAKSELPIQIVNYSIMTAKSGFEAGVDTILLLMNQEPVFNKEIKNIKFF